MKFNKTKVGLSVLFGIAALLSVKTVQAATYACIDSKANVIGKFSTANCDNACKAPNICSEWIEVTPANGGPGTFVGGNTGSGGTTIGGNTGGGGTTNGAGGGAPQNSQPQPSTQTIEIPNPLKSTCPGKSDLECLVSRIFTILWVLAFPIVTLMILIGAYQIMTSAGDSEKITAGRNTIKWAVIGFAILILSRSIVYIIEGVLGAAIK